MKNIVTFGHAVAILSIIVLPLIGWGVSVETRFEGSKSNTLEIEENKKEIESLQQKLEEKAKSDNANFILVLEKLHEIELELKDKKNR